MFADEEEPDLSKYPDNVKTQVDDLYQKLKMKKETLKRNEKNVKLMPDDARMKDRLNKAQSEVNQIQQQIA